MVFEKPIPSIGPLCRIISQEHIVSATLTVTARYDGFIDGAPLFLEKTRFLSPVGKHCKADTRKHNRSSKWQRRLQRRCFQPMTPTILGCHSPWPMEGSGCVKEHMASPGTQLKHSSVCVAPAWGIIGAFPPGCISPQEDSPELGLTEQENEKYYRYIQSWSHRRTSTLVWRKNLKWTNTPQT